MEEHEGRKSEAVGGGEERRGTVCGPAGWLSADSWRRS